LSDTVLAHLLAAGFAILLWWGGTALVFFLDHKPQRQFGRVMFGATVLLIGAIALAVSLADTRSAAAAYVGFTCGVVVWAWQELAFLTGWLTGPRREPCPAGAFGWARFRAAVAAVLHHELAILAGGLLLLVLLFDAGNRVALDTYLLLAVMRLSAKLNVFLGARNLGEDMLPAHLAHIGSFFRRSRMNVFFPFSLLGGIAATLLLLHQGIGGDPFAQTAWTLLATMMALAVIEHVFMMMPLPLDGLWTWQRARHAPTSHAPASSPPETLPLRP
jgi:putative photosynthetic complex assembly protein 2